MDRRFKNISEKMIKRYSERFKKLGYHIRTLGWGSQEQQEYRFEQTLDTKIDFSKKAILDLGCGFGDYADFLVKKGVSFSDYLGWDINKDLINEAKIRHKDIDNMKFGEVDMLNMESISEPVADIAVMLGVLNLKQEEVDNYEYSELFIKKAFSLVREVLVVDFLSSELTDDYPKEDFVFYHQPNKMIEIASHFSSNVILKDDYKPNPQKEFMLLIYK